MRFASAIRTVTVLLAVAALVALATIPLDWQQQAIFGAMLAAAAFLMDRLSPGQFGTLSLVGISIFCTVRYAFWRAGETWRFIEANGVASMGTDLIFVLILLAAECYAMVILLLGYFQAARPLQRQPEPLPADPEEWPTVDIFIPTYNEPLDVVRPTVLGALNIDWPGTKRKVYILDDGTRPEFEAFAAECGAGYIIRSEHVHAKAGNINNALGETTGEFVAIFDADHVATRSFLQMTMGWFLRDPKLAMMQTPHHFYSPDPFERNLGVFRKVSNEGALFYGVLQDGNDLWNATFFCGSCAVIRRSALMEIGGIAVETVTEDAHTSLRLQMRGWNTSYLAVPQAAGLATANLAEHIGQRIRWSRGMVQILRLDNPLFARGLAWHQRLCYFNAVAHFLFALPRLVFLTAPLLYLLFGVSNIIGYVVSILAYALPHLTLATMTNSRIQGRHRLSFWNEIYEVVLTPYILLPTLAALVNPKWGKFNVTPKSTKVDQAFFDWRTSSPFLVLAVLIVAGIANGLLRMSAEPGLAGTIWVNIIWCVANLLTIGGAFAVANERAQRREKARIETRMECEVLLSNGAVFETHTSNISETGAALAMPARWKAQPGDQATLRFPQFEGTPEIPFEVVTVSKGVMRAFFPAQTLAHAEAITRVAYGRADSWLDWKTGPDDRPLVSLLQIVWVSLRGYAAVIQAMFKALRRGRGPQKQLSEAAEPIAAAALFPLLLAAAASLLTPSAYAQPANGPVFSETVELRSLGMREPAALHGLDGQATVRFQVPVSKIATEASLTVNMRTAAAIQSNAFRIHVSLNGVEVAAIETDPNAKRSAVVELPADLLLTENQVSFRVVGTCNPCTPEAREQTSYIDPSTAIRISGVILPLANDLRLLPAPFFDASSRYRTELTFALPRGADAHVLQAAGVLSSWFGALADHRGIHFPVSVGSIPAGNAIVFAPVGSTLASQLGFDGTTEPLVAVRDNPNDAHGKLLVIAGADGKQLLTAASYLATRSSAMQGDVAKVDINFKPAAQDAVNGAPRWANTSQPLLMSSLAASDALKVQGSGSSRVYFRLPPGLYYGSRSVVPLRLSYRYGKFRNGSRGTIQVRLNGSQVTVLTVGANDSAQVLHAIVQVPAGLLYPRNTLDFEFRHQAGRGDTSNSAELPVGQILGTSALDLTEVRNFTQLPRLDLFANSGFPFTRHADLSHTAVAMPERPTPEQVGLYLDLLGYFGAQTGYPAVRVQVLSAQEAARSGKDVLAIGLTRENTASGYRQAPLYEQNGGFTLQAPEGFWNQLRHELTSRFGGESSRLRDALDADAPDAVLQAWAMPAGTSVVAISTQTQQGANDFVAALSAAANDANISGSVSLYQNGKFQSFRVGGGESYVGSLDSFQMFQYRAARQWLSLPLLVAVLAMLLGYFSSQWLERRAVARIGSTT